MRVRYTLNAAAEFAEVLDYIAERSPQGAQKVDARFRAVERLLAAFPESGKQGRDRPWLRRITLQPYPYVVFYEVTAAEVWIQRVRHTARDPAED